MRTGFFPMLHGVPTGLFGNDYFKCGRDFTLPVARGTTGTVIAKFPGPNNWDTLRFEDSVHLENRMQE